MPELLEVLWWLLTKVIAIAIVWLSFRHIWQEGDYRLVSPLKWDRLYTSQRRSRSSRGQLRREESTSREGRGSIRANGTRPCPDPGCTGTLRQRYGRYGRFLGCSNYPACRHTENLDA